MDWVLATVIGTGTALVELLSRYRDEPFKVIATSQFAWVYLLLNALLALGAHGVLLDSSYAPIADAAEVPSGRAALGMIAGLAAAVVLRSKVFTARIGDEQVSIGPGYVVDQLLSIIDAQIDRRRALERVRIVVDVMTGRDFEGSKQHASTMVTGSRQSLSLQDQKDLANQMREIIDRQIPDQEKSYALGFVLLDFMGEEFLREVATNLPKSADLGEPSERQPLTETETKSIVETNGNVLAPRDWGASLPVQRAKLVRELLGGVPFEPVRKRVVTLLDSGQLGNSEDERLALRLQIAEVLEREDDSDADKVFALGFVVHNVWNSGRFRDAFEDLSRAYGGERARVSEESAITKLSRGARRGLKPTVVEEPRSFTPPREGSSVDKPITGQHKTIGQGAGPIPMSSGVDLPIDVDEGDEDGSD